MERLKTALVSFIFAPNGTVFLIMWNIVYALIFIYSCPALYWASLPIAFRTSINFLILIFSRGS